MQNIKLRFRKLWGIMVKYFGQRAVFYPRYLRFKGSQFRGWGRCLKRSFQ